MNKPVEGMAEAVERVLTMGGRVEYIPPPEYTAGYEMQFYRSSCERLRRIVEIQNRHMNWEQRTAALREIEALTPNTR